MRGSEADRQQEMLAAWTDRRPVYTENESGLTPLGHAVLVRTYEPEVSKSLIEIPKAVQMSMQSMDQRAEVIAVGPNAWDSEPAHRAKPGDKVLITKFAGFVAGETMTKDGKTYRLINDRDIFCRIDWKEVDQ